MGKLVVSLVHFLPSKCLFAYKQLFGFILSYLNFHPLYSWFWVEIALFFGVFCMRLVYLPVTRVYSFGFGISFSKLKGLFCCGALSIRLRSFIIGLHSIFCLVYPSVFVFISHLGQPLVKLSFYWFCCYLFRVITSVDLHHRHFFISSKVLNSFSTL